MADDDDIARLLREVEAATGGGPPPEEKQAESPKREARRAKGKEVAATDDGSGGIKRTQWALIAAAGSGAVGFVGGTLLGFLPYVDGFTAAMGAAAGAALTGLVGRPPRWLS